MTSFGDGFPREAFEPARSLEPTDAEVARVVARVVGPRSRGARRRRPLAGRRLVLACVILLLLLGAGGYAAAPPIRAAIDDVAGTFGGWLGGNDAAAPGRPLGAGDQAPSYFHGPGYRDPRVIAEAGGYKLYAVRTAGGGVDFDLGHTGVGLGEVSAGRFHDRTLIVLGPGAMQTADSHGHVPLFGITARSVRSVELTYESGPPLRLSPVNGAFVLLAEPDRRPHEIVARDASGGELGRTLVDDSPHQGPRIDWSRYRRR
jgi:hypothetical protein